VFGKKAERQLRGGKFPPLFFSSLKKKKMKQVIRKQRTQQQTVNNIISSPRNLHKSPTGVPQFPAFNSNLSLTDVRKFIQQQPRCTGVSFSAPLGQFVINNIQLPGDARLFLGLIFTSTVSDTDTFTMTLNNNKIIDNASIFLHATNNSASVTTQYYQYLQPLTGKDIFTFQLNTGGAFKGVLQLHYI